jgi:hypothetical protein
MSLEQNRPYEAPRFHVDVLSRREETASQSKLTFLILPGILGQVVFSLELAKTINERYQADGISAIALDIPFNKNQVPQDEFNNWGNLIADVSKATQGPIGIIGYCAGSVVAMKYATEHRSDLDNGRAPKLRSLDLITPFNPKKIFDRHNGYYRETLTGIDLSTLKGPTDGGLDFTRVFYSPADPVISQEEHGVLLSQELGVTPTITSRPEWGHFTIPFKDPHKERKIQEITSGVIDEFLAPRIAVYL